MSRMNWRGMALVAAAVVIFMFVVLYKTGDWFSGPVFSEKARTKHLVVISLDALNAKDYPSIMELPNFKQILESGSYVKEVTGVYPSLTYPSHTTIITGKYPINHGVVDNTMLQPGAEKPDWYWYKKYIKAPTLYDLARSSHMKVGALLWPVTAKADIDYNLPEIWPNKKGQNQIWLSLSSGSPMFLLDLQLRYGKIRKGTNEPELDDFNTASACHLIRSKKPNLALIHLTDIDKQRHLYGFSSAEAVDAIKRQDRRVGEIIQAAKDAGIYEDTTFIILGDHGFQDVQYRISANTVLKEAGLISTGADGRLTDWKAYVHSCDGSAYVFLKDKNDQEARSKLERILESLKSDPKSGIEAVYSREQAVEFGASDQCDYMLEARNGFYFVNDIIEMTVTKIEPGQVDYDKDIFAATHGYSPWKPGYKTVFMAAGKGIKKGVVIPSVNMVDEGPTMAALLGLQFPDPDGKVLEQLLEK